MKKFKNKSQLEIYNPFTALEGHIFAFGRIGAGKSVSILSIIQGFHDNYGFKIWDMFGGERHEGLYWTIPNKDESYWNKLKFLGVFDETGPKQYKVNLLYPYWEGKIPKKLPKKEGVVNSKVFTIPLDDVTIEDIRMVIGNPGETSKYIWNEILHNCKRKDNSFTLVQQAKKLKAVNSILYKSFILPISRSKFLMDKYCDYNIDIREESKDIETITVLCLDFVPEKFHLFIINYIMRKMIELIDKNKIKKKNILFLREAATFFRATDDSVLEDRFKIFRVYMANYIRMGRRGTYFALDCQSCNEVRGLVQGSEDFLLMFRTTSYRDKMEMCEELRKERRMRPDQISDLAFLEKGQCCIAETGKVVKKVQICMPRTQFWKKEYGNFYNNLWERLEGTWMYLDKIRDYINERDYSEVETPKKITLKPLEPIGQEIIKPGKIVYPPEPK